MVSLYIRTNKTKVLLCVVQVAHVPEGLEAVIFTSDGDMRQALNSLQATVAGFNMVNRDNVFKVRSRGQAYEATALLRVPRIRASR